MGFFSEILSGKRTTGKSERREIADVEAALDDLRAKRTASNIAISAALAERDSLLLVDGSDDRLAEIDALVDQHHLMLERLEKAEPLLLAELATLRTEANQAHWNRLKAEHEAAAADYAKSLKALVVQKEHMMALYDKACSAGFQHEVAAAFIPPTSIISRDALNQFEFAIERQRELTSRRPVRAAVLPVIPVKQVPKQVVAASVKIAKPAAAAKPAAKPFVPPKSDENGNVAIVVLKPGFERDGVAAKINDVLHLPADEARRLVISTVAEFVAALEPIADSTAKV